MKPRTDIHSMRDIPNVGPATTRDLARLRIFHPADLVGKDPFRMYEELCRLTGMRHDPCVIDVFLSAVRFMEGAPPRKWWSYTPERKRQLLQAEKRSAHAPAESELPGPRSNAT